jgi:hypothetical protein
MRKDVLWMAGVMSIALVTLALVPGRSGAG